MERLYFFDDCTEWGFSAGAYLISCGIRGAMLFMSWLGILVLPVIEQSNAKKRGSSSSSVSITKIVFLHFRNIVECSLKFCANAYTGSIRIFNATSLATYS